MFNRVRGNRSDLRIELRTDLHGGFEIQPVNYLLEFNVQDWHLLKLFQHYLAKVIQECFNTPLSSQSLPVPWSGSWRQYVRHWTDVPRLYCLPRKTDQIRFVGVSTRDLSHVACGNSSIKAQFLIRVVSCIRRIEFVRTGNLMSVPPIGNEHLHPCFLAFNISVCLNRLSCRFKIFSRFLFRW